MGPRQKLQIKPAAKVPDFDVKWTQKTTRVQRLRQVEMRGFRRGGSASVRGIGFLSPGASRQIPHFRKNVSLIQWRASGRCWVAKPTSSVSLPKVV